jgi:hypothetical protein
MERISILSFSSEPGARVNDDFKQALREALDCVGNDASRLATQGASIDVTLVLTDLVPLSLLMAKQITGLRTWAKGRARLATAPSGEAKLRKLAVQ